MRGLNLNNQITSQSAKGLVVRISGLGLTYLSTVLVANYLGTAQFGMFGAVMSLSPIWMIGAIGGVDNLATKSIATVSRENLGATAHEIALTHAAGLLGVALGLILVGLVWFVLMQLDMEPQARIVRYSMIVFPIMLMINLRQSIALPLSGAAAAMLPEQIVLPIMFSALLVVRAKLFSHIYIDDVMVLYFIAALLAWSFGIVLILKKGVLQALRQKITFGDLLQRFRQGRPFYLAAVSNIVIVNSVTVLISFLLGFRAAGMYFAASRLSSLSYVPLGVIDQVVAPAAARYHKDGDHSSLSELAKWSTSLAFVGGLSISSGIAIFHQPLLHLFGEGFQDAGGVLLILLAGQTVNTFFGPNAALMRMTGLERLFSQIFLVTAVVLPLSVYVSALVDGIELVSICVSTMIVGWNALLCWCLWSYRKLVVLPYRPVKLVMQAKEAVLSILSWKSWISSSERRSVAVSHDDN